MHQYPWDAVAYDDPLCGVSFLRKLPVVPQRGRRLATGCNMITVKASGVSPETIWIRVGEPLSFINDDQ